MSDSLPPDRSYPKSKQALLVAGCHRSGTSALARVISLLGAGLPKDLMGPAVGNQRGHWESLRLVAVNDELLTELERSWSDPRPLPAEWELRASSRAIIGKLASLIAEEFGDARLIVLKDPRIARLAPIYIAALIRSGFAPNFVIPVRSPMETIESLIVRDLLDPRSAELVWIRHLLEVELASRGYPRVWTTFDELLNDWRALQSKVASALGLEWQTRPDLVAADIDAFLEPSMRHTAAIMNEATKVGGLAMRIWQASKLGAAGREEALQREFDAVRAIVNEMDRFVFVQSAADSQAPVRTVDLSEQVKALTLQTQAWRTEDQSWRQEFASWSQQLLRSADSHDLRSQLQQVAAALGSERRELQAKLDAVEAEAGHLRLDAAEAARLRVALAETTDRMTIAEQELSELHRSTSWRITGPLRSIGTRHPGLVRFLRRAARLR